MRTWARGDMQMPGFHIFLGNIGGVVSGAIGAMSP